MEKHKLVIIGSGPAGFTAAIYAARANLSPLLYEGFFSGAAGGQLMMTTEVENFPGFPEGISGPKLMEACKKQAERFGTQVIKEDVQAVDLSKHPFRVEGTKLKVLTDSLIIATGATAKRLDIEGTRDGEFWQKGVTACAVCDGAMPIFRDRELFVIGGGDTAVEEALFLTKYGRQVYIVHRRDQLRASKVMAEHAFKNPKIKILWNHVLKRVEGKDVVTSVTLQNVQTQKETKHVAAGVFFAIGHNPNTSFIQNQLKTDEMGYLIVKPYSTCTDIEGVFAAGDVQDKVYRQAISAAGSGCMAALDAERYLTKLKIDA